MSIWDLAACVDGVNYANNPEARYEAPTDEQFEAMLEAYNVQTATAH